MKLQGIKVTVNYPETEVEAAVPSEMDIDQLCETLKKLMETEPDMTSMVVVAVRASK